MVGRGIAPELPAPRRRFESGHGGIGRKRGHDSRPSRQRRFQADVRAGLRTAGRPGDSGRAEGRRRQPVMRPSIERRSSMRYRYLLGYLIAVAMVVGFGSTKVLAQADQGKKYAPPSLPKDHSKPAPRTADGHPDLSGMWI